MSEYTLLSIDQGTTSTRAILFSKKGEVLDSEQKELELFYPHKGWVEQDAAELWRHTKACVQAVLNRAHKEGRFPKAVGVTSQRETTVIWDRSTGKPVYNAIVWQDRRTSDYCAELKKRGLEGDITQKTGLLIDPYFSATKIRWILENVEGASTRAKKGDLAFGTIDSWVLWNLTGGQVHKSDVTNAARTLLYDIVAQEWSKELLGIFDIPAALLPNVHDNVYEFGVCHENITSEELPILAMAGDQQAAMIGQACFEEGMVKSTYGTGCFALMNIGKQYKLSCNRLLTTPAYRLNGEIHYAIEGAIFVAGAAIQWLRDGLGFFEKARDSEALACSVNDNGGVYLVPAFTGLGAPHWEPEARGLITGLGRDSTKAHITRAALEAQAYQTYDLLDAMIEDSGYNADIVRVDGGLAANKFMCQFLSDMLQRRVEVPAVHEATAWGSAALAGLGYGMFSSLDEISSVWKAADIYDPAINSAQRDALYEGWKQAVKMVRTPL